MKKKRVYSIMRRLAAFFAAVAIFVSVAGCGAVPNTQTDPAAVLMETEGRSISVTDQAGRTVTLEQPAQTLVSCYYITTYATMALGISDRVVGLEKKANTRPIYHMAAPALLEKEQVGTLKDFSVETAAALDPDLVLMPQKLEQYADTLTELGIQVLVVDPESQEDMEQMLLLIGEACGVLPRAQELVTYYHQQLDRINELVAGQEAPRVYMAGNGSYLTAAPNEMYQSDLIGIAGGQNAMASLSGDYWTEVSYEAILAADPQVMVIPGGASYTAADVLADPNLSDVQAVREQRVYQMPTGIEEWDSPIPSGILGALWLTSVLHPEVYPFDTFCQDAADFYQTFYGFEIDKGLITQ